MKVDQVTFLPDMLFCKHSSSVWSFYKTCFTLRPYRNSLHFCLPFTIQTAYTRVIPASTCFYNTFIQAEATPLPLRLSIYTVWAEASGEPKNRTALHTYSHPPLLSCDQQEKHSLQKNFCAMCTRSWWSACFHNICCKHDWMPWTARTAELHRCT